MSPKSVYRSSSRKPIRLSQAGRGGARPDRRRGARKHRRSAVQDALVRACRPAASGLISAAMRRASAPATTPTPRPPQISRSARGTDAANHSRVSSLEASFGLAPGCSVSCLSIIGWDELYPHPHPRWPSPAYYQEADHRGRQHSGEQPVRRVHRIHCAALERGSGEVHRKPSDCRAKHHGAQLTP